MSKARAASSESVLSELAAEIDDLDLEMESDDLDDDRRPRPTREMDARAVEKTIQWRPANYLPDPAPRRGWVHRWIRVEHGGGSTDAANMAKAMREGWRPVPPSEYPEMTELMFGRSSNSDTIEFGGLVLCRLPEETNRQRNEYFTGLARRQLKSINERLRENAGDDRIEFQVSSRTEVKRHAR